MLNIARTTGVQTVVMNGIVTHQSIESCDSVLVGTGNEKVLGRCLKIASDGADTTWKGRSFQTVAQETRLPTVERRERMLLRCFRWASKSLTFSAPREPWSPDPLTRGSAPLLRWGLPPIIGSPSALALCGHPHIFFTRRRPCPTAVYGASISSCLTRRHDRTLSQQSTKLCDNFITL